MRLRSGVYDDDRKWKKLIKEMRGVGAAYVTVGLHADAKPYETGQAEAATVAQIASVHEFGSQDGHVPMRAFFRPTIDANREKYAALLERVMRLVIAQKLPLKKALSLVGLQVAVDVKRAITDLTDPPLAESTIARKKAKAAYLGAEKAEAYAESGANPLVDTGHMRHSVTYDAVISHQSVDHPESVGGRGE